MNFDKIVSEAMDKAMIAVIEKDVSGFPPLQEDLQHDVDVYRPVIKYVNALVAESLRIYHESVHKQ